MAKEVSIEEGAVKVVRCSVTNEPMQNVPGWYSDVKVRFVSDKGRKNSDVHADVLPPDEPVKPVDDDEGDISLDELQDEEDAGEDVDGGEGDDDVVVSLLDDDTDEE